MIQMIDQIANWEKEYKKMVKNLSEREIELLDGSPIKSHEGMMYGAMYADWKVRKGFDNA
tara:strand:+ start:189 stop:368 length:180 start_codon:yes stop_codon:yes gene_type:complete